VTAFVTEEAFSDLHPEGEAWVIAKSKQGTHGASFGIATSKDESRDPRLEQRTGAHDTRFEGDVNRAAFDAPIFESIGSRAQRDDFRVTQDVTVGMTAVCPPTEEGAISDDDRANGHLSLRSSPFGEVEREVHV